MKFCISLVFLLLWWYQPVSGQTYTPQIELHKGMVKADSRLIVQSGYLVVPENRAHIKGRKIKIPFVFARRPDQDPRKGVSLYSNGGPGYATVGSVDSISYHSDWLSFGGFIFMSQRGTKGTEPCLKCQEVPLAIKRSYREGHNRDSLVLLAVQACRRRLTAQGIDLEGYTTLESAEDINDLRRALHLDSLNLVGISYSGGLMLTVARLHPEAVRSLILNSPLPTQVNYEESALLNINEALEQVFTDGAKDSTDQKIYGSLRERFHQYFSSITGKKFFISYLEPGTKDSIKVTYGKNELLDAVVNRLNTGQLRTVPGVIQDIISGRHDPYILEVLDDYFSGNDHLAEGMRYSVYCSEQIAYANPHVQENQDSILPWLSGYRFNNVDNAICKCWKVRAEPAVVKTPIYSNVPTLITAGDADPWCRPFYNRLIKRTMPNSQLLIIHDRGHGAGYYVDGTDYLQLFMKHPYQKLEARSKNVVVE